VPGGTLEVNRTPDSNSQIASRADGVANSLNACANLRESVRNAALSLRMEMKQVRNCAMSDQTEMVLAEIPECLTRLK